ncbi:radical SAM family heme chaperone HemW [Undibacterium oligocarboniphilum]|uniref:Heme chaperone HemW n=1 Tax=Undibacterium oligocarboniphilum TaxID=666702 RepID=A0A850QQE2_9BURK|nr:radical SAM family heme chaperone HemW [Undibacterium oligocarboniphilum]MBC3870295.1 oxygen-independent coproporphyrinogen III oxidase-like protein [Undibacterium oligocarboniphilum]NVO78286.1 oxygen-independent coproporphyrinogen III oxidase-like protein [Undibacterium oligocarboniphilum]
MIPIKPISPQTESTQQATSLSDIPQLVASQFLTPGDLHLNALPPLSLYVHFPWCVKKCPYCDFNSHEVKGGFDEKAYLNALRTDLEASLPLIWGRKIYTIFIGGGTPSLLSASGIDQMMSDIRSLLPLDNAAEITLEANPGTFEAEKFRTFRGSGINRLSIGIQSFHSGHLSALGRIHDGDQARRAIDIAQTHFENFNLDLMFALPGQTLAEVRQDIATAQSFAPPHLSLYHLTLEPNTYFAKYPPAIPDDDLSAEMQDLIHQTMANAGYTHYEVSAYARPGREARHNLNYWNFGDYLGIGAGAHSKLSFPHRIVRQMKYKQPKAYMDAAMKGNATQESAEISKQDLPFEFMLNALRLNQGFPVHLFQERTGLLLNSIEKKLQQAEAKQLIQRDHLKIMPTPMGRLFLNDLQQIFL